MAMSLPVGSELHHQSIESANTAASDCEPLFQSATSSPTFTLFSKLPAELRLKIWRFAIPRRVLQLGTDVPYPFLRKSPSSTIQLSKHIRPGIVKAALLPIPVSQPSIFYACHDSRALCLEEYTPFGYTYIHPVHDTLYISRHAIKLLQANMSMDREGARPSLYPIGLLGRLAMELHPLDLPMRPWHSEIPCRPLWTVLAAFGSFGAPRELLIVQTEESHDATPFILWQTRKEYTNLEITDVAPAISSPAWKADEVTDFVQNIVKEVFRGPWCQRQVPKVRCVGMKMDTIVETQYQSLEKFLPLGNMISTKWHQEMLELYGKHWDYNVHGNSFHPEHMERALARHKEKLRDPGF